jgi:predicted MFS family arabinose efflux permease
MLDLRFFRRPTYIGANIAGLAYAAALLTMLTYLPLYFQGVLGFDPQAAGLAMLPMAFPLFLVPRIVATHLTQRLSGRMLLTLGLGILALGMMVLFLGAYSSQYYWMLPGMLTSGIGAGVLNGETAKVGMTVIPPERAGMAAGVGGTVRFTGIVVGIAALGALLFSKVADTIAFLVPNLSDLQQAQITQAIISGDISPVTNGGILSVVVRHNLGYGYQTLFMTSAVIAAVAAMAAWMLVKESDTAAHR